MSEKEKGSSVIECHVKVDLMLKMKLHFTMVERNCRIYRLSIDMTNDNHEFDCHYH